MWTLDETNDFQESQIEKKLKKRQENPVFICVVCQTDLAHLSLEERSIHINQCIDGQSSDDIPSQDIGTENVFILDCPLCFKHFSSPEVRCAHIKKCGKSRGLSSQSVIQAIRLQEKHILERRALGLPLNNKPAKQLKKPIVKKFLTKPKSALESDIHLAKALSLSLKEKESRSQSNFESEDIIPTTVLQPPAEFQNPGRIVPKKHTLKPTPILLLRTEDERQKIVLEKVNAIIASVSEPKKDEVFGEEHSTYSQQTAFLWNLSSKAEINKTYYVEQLLDWISPTDIKVGSKLNHLSQIPGHHIFTQHPCDYTFSCSEKSDINNTSMENNPPPSLMNSLQSLVGSSWMSDVDIYTDGGVIVPAHKLLLALRYPLLKNKLNEPTINGRHILHWENTSLDAVKLFLNFIYTGSAEWKEDTIDDLYKLALSYEVSDLLDILNSNNEALEILANGITQETPRHSFMDVEISNKERNYAAVSSGKPGHDFAKNSQVFVMNNTPNCRNANNEDLSSQRIDELGCNFIPNSIDRTNTNEINIVENVQPKNVVENTDICILNLNNTNHIANKNCEFSSNFDACNTDSNSNDSCKILETNISSKLQTSFDTSQKEDIMVISSEKCKMPNNKVYDHTNPCILSYHASTKASQENIDFPNLSPHSFQTTCIEKVSPFKKAPHKNISENISSEVSLSSKLCVENEIASNNPSYIKQKSFENKCSYSQNLKKDVFVSNVDEAVIVLDDEQNSKAEKYPVGENVLGMLSPRKVSPLKNSKISPSSFYNDCRSCSADFNSSIQFGSTHWEETESNSPKSVFEKNNTVTPIEIKTRDVKEMQTLFEVNSLKSSSKMDYQNKSLSSKKSIENCLNDNIHERNIISSPEILICDSDNELDPLLERNYLKSTENSPEKTCKPDEVELILGKNYFEEHDKLSEKDIGLFSSSDENKYSNMVEKINLPEIIHCESNLYISEDKTIKSSKSCIGNDISNKNIKFIESDCTELENNTDEHSFTLAKHYESCINEKPSEVIDVIDCHSDPNDDEVSKKESLDDTKEIILEDDILNDDYMNDIPLLERIQMNKMKTDTSKISKYLFEASPDSPWIFRTSKHQQASEIDSNSFKGPVCFSQQNSDVEPKSLSDNKNSIKEKSKKGGCTTSPNDINPKFKLSDSPITPLPDFKSMMTPQLKEALRRVGVKALPRKKAVAVLSHIYDETHPWNDDHSEDQPDLEIQSSSKNIDHTRNVSLPKKRKQTIDNLERPLKKTVKSNTNKSKEKNRSEKNKFPKFSSCASSKDCIEMKQIYSSESKMSSSECSTSSPSKSSSPKKNDLFNFSQSSEFSDCSQAESKDDPKLISQYISSNDELYKKVLTYAPLNLMELQHELKENGINVSVKKLMDYLDEQCITFTCPRKEEYKKKQQARTQRFRKRMIAKLSQQKNFNAS